MRNSFSSENNTRSAASRIGLTPQNKAKNGERELLHIWAVRPGKTPGREYVHENAAVFTPLRNTRTSPNTNRSPFGNMNKNALKTEKSRRVAGLLESWGPTASNASILGEGATGTVMTVPVEAVRRALVKSTFNPIAPLPSSGRVAVKFQLVRSSGDLKNFVRETQVHSVALTPRGSLLSKFVPKLYAAYYDPDARVHVTIMQMVRGETLQSIMDAGGKLTEKEYSWLARAFFALWNRGIFHTDAHGGNIFIRRGANSNVNNGNPVTLIDFGQSSYIPPELRPATLAQALDPVFQARLETYVGSLKTGQDWFNPNTRALKIAKSMVTGSGKSNSNTVKNAVFRSITNNVKKSSSGWNLAPSTANRLSNRVANRTRNSGNTSVFNNGSGKTVVNNGNVSVSIAKNVKNNSSKNGSNNAGRTPSNKNSNSSKNSGGSSSTRGSPSQRKQMIKTVTREYENMLSNFVNKTRPVAFIKTTNIGKDGRS